jgi:hypothetical protein
MATTLGIRATADDPAGGRIEVQQAVLLAVRRGDGYRTWPIVPA